LSLLCAACALVVGLVVWLATGSGGAAVDGVGGSAVTGAVASSSPRPSTVAEEASEERSDSATLEDSNAAPLRPDLATRVDAQPDKLDPRFDVFVVGPSGAPVLGAQVLGLVSFELEGDATVHPFGLTDR